MLRYQLIRQQQVEIYKSPVYLGEAKITAESLMSYPWDLRQTISG